MRRGRPVKDIGSVIKNQVKDGNNDAMVYTQLDAACRILLWAEVIAANVKSQLEDIWTLQTALKLFLSKTIK